MSKNVLVIAPHPDDETLGCGGSLLKHLFYGDKIYWLIVTNAFPGKFYKWSEEMVAIRQKEIDKVSRLFNFTKTFKLNYPTAELEQVPLSDLIGAISHVVKEVLPEIIYLPNRNDIHTDHRIVFNAAYSCTKSFRFPSIKKILMYETLSETEFAPALPENSFTPNVFIDISDFIENKIEILKIYKSEIINGPQPRSIDVVKSLARYRGSSISKKYAESFILLKEEL